MCQISLNQGVRTRRLGPDLCSLQYAEDSSNLTVTALLSLFPLNHLISQPVTVYPLLCHRDWYSSSVIASPPLASLRQVAIPKHTRNRLGSFFNPSKSPFSKGELTWDMCKGDAGGGTRTRTNFLHSADFKSAASAIPPPRHMSNCIAFKPSVQLL